MKAKGTGEEHAWRTAPLPDDPMIDGESRLVALAIVAVLIALAAGIVIGAISSEIVR